ncbi:hypothetical protein P3472_23415 [Vibrio parahaemolyticus]|nr:hypothetical protein [Vibrio parahaemolyticus]
MTKKHIYTWLGAVSGVFTILLAFTNPFSDKADLVGYVRTMEHIPPNILKIDEDERRYRSLQLTLITVKNEGELPASKVHVKLKNSFEYGVLSVNDKFVELDTQNPIYVDRLESDNEFNLMFWSDRYILGSYRALDSISISSENGGKATLRTDIEGTPLSWFIEQYLFFIVMGLVIIFFLLISILASALEELKKGELSSECSFKEDLDNLNYAWSIGAIEESKYQEKAKKIIDSKYG